MIGLLVVTHGEFGASMLKTAQGILGPQEQAAALSLLPGMGLEDLGARIRESKAALDTGSGLLVLVDLFGGTPCNAGLALCADPGVEVVAGVNLPLLVEALMLRAALPLPELARAAVEKGRESMVAASQQLRQRLAE